MKRLRTLAVLPLLLALCGCMGGTSITSVDRVPEGTSYQGRKVLGIIKAENRGMFLFYGIPLWTGRPTSPNYRQYAMFRNYLRPGYMDQMLEYEGRLLNAKKIAVVHASEQSRGWFSLWIVWARQMRTEGIALGKEVEESLK